MFERFTRIPLSLVLTLTGVSSSWGENVERLVASDRGTLPVTVSATSAADLSDSPTLPPPRPLRGDVTPNVPSVIQPFRTIQLHGLPDERIPVITSVAIQPHGHLLATAGDDHMVRVWDLETGRLAHELKSHRDWVTALAYTPDGTRLVSGCRGGRVVVWDATLGTLIRRLDDLPRAVTAIACSPAADHLVAVVGFKTPLKLFNGDSGELVRDLACPCVDMRTIRFSPDGRYLVGGGRNGRIRIWDVQHQTSTDLDAHRRRVRAITFAERGLRFISAGEDQRVLVWQLEGPPTAQGRSVVTTLANSLTDSDLPQRRDPPVVPQVLKEAEELTESAKVLSLALLDENTLCTATSENEIRIWDLRTGKTMQTLRGHTGSIASLVVENGALVSGSFDTTVRVWKLHTVGP